MKKFITSRGALYLIIYTCVAICSCSEEGAEQRPAEPVITFDHADKIYAVKTGRQVTITPLVANDEGAIYTWTTAAGEIIGREKVLVYTWTESGQVYVTFRVLTAGGTAEEEIRVDVMPLVKPTIALGVPEGGFVVMTGDTLRLSPAVDNDSLATYAWRVDGVAAASTREYAFVAAREGTFQLSLTAVNEDGEDMIVFPVRVASVEAMPFSWVFERDTFNTSVGRAIRLVPFSITNARDAAYTWEVDGEEVQQGANPLYRFEAATEGVFHVTVTMRNSHVTVKRDLVARVCPPEGTYRRAATGGSKAACDKVYEYLPAPGQFINEELAAPDMAAACRWAEGRFAGGAHASLGGFGGYIVVGFDHSVDNDGDYNIAVLGNSFTGSSEPGIVYVMQDENGDGRPNDTWYELKGSEHGKAGTVMDYEVTYFRPRLDAMPVSWADNRGKTGTVDYLQAYHRQASYYPAWVGADAYTLRGTLLESRTREVSPGFWSNDDFPWGYADNFSSVDRLVADDNYNAAVNANHFKISNAVMYDGSPVDLKYIDFVKVQSGVNAKAGWLGENSTEVFGVRDFNIAGGKD